MLQKIDQLQRIGGHQIHSTGVLEVQFAPQLTHNMHDQYFRPCLCIVSSEVKILDQNVLEVLEEYKVLS